MKNLTKLQQGTYGVGSAINYFTSMGWTVYVPINDSQDHDLVVEEKSILKKVQVKTTKFIPKGSNYYQVELQTKRSDGGRRKTLLE